MTTVKRVLLKTGIMFLVLLALAVGLTVYGRRDPRETYSFAQLFEFVVTELVVGPSVLAFLLVLAHDSLSMRLQVRSGLTPLTVGVSVGGGLGFLLGAFWGVLSWGANVALLGLVVGGVYGLLVVVLAQGRLLAPTSTTAEGPKAPA
ncbi:MAG: hypothetical protein ACREMF_00795 [Gemmatimonadales bacterium]